MRSARYTVMRILTHAGSLLPLGWLIWAYETNHLSVNPIQAATQRTGADTITLLVISLACTPLNTLLGIPEFIKLRRTFGLYTFLYASIHLLMFAGVDYQFNLHELLGSFLIKPYILAGLGTFLILLPLAVTSFRWFMKHMGKNWRRLHNLIYLAAMLAVLHYAWVVKGNLIQLHGDVWKPFLYSILVAFLLVLRIPVVRRWVVNRRIQLVGYIRQRFPLYLPTQPEKPKPVESLVNDSASGSVDSMPRSGRYSK